MCIIPASLVSAVGYVQTYSWERAAGLECPPRSSRLRRPADGIVCPRGPPPPQRACPTLGAPSTRCRGGRGAVSRWTTRGSQGVSLQFLPGLPHFLPRLALGLPPHLPSRLFSFVSLPFLPFSFLPFPSFLFFVCRTENTAVTFPPSEAQYDHSMNSSLSLYFLSCLVNDMYFSCYLYT